MLCSRMTLRVRQIIHNVPTTLKRNKIMTCTVISSMIESSAVNTRIPRSKIMPSSSFTLLKGLAETLK